MKKKFTLIELIIVILVIGLLAAMALPKVIGIVQNAKISAMINDKEVLEKMMILYSQKHDNLPLLNEDQKLIVLNDNVSLIKLVKAENIISEDMKTIYTSLQETLKHYNDEEESLYRIDLSKTKDYLSKSLKYGHKKEDKDFYVYSTKTKNVYYYEIMKNGDGEIQHSEFNTTLKESELVDKKFSYNLSEDGLIINSKPIVELTTDLSNITMDTTIKWSYNFIDEDKTPTKISFILNNVEYTNFDNIPTKLDGGDYTIKLKMQDSKGLWSDEVIKSFSISKDIISQNIELYYSNGIGGGYESFGFFDKQGNFNLTNSTCFNQNRNTFNLYFVFDSKLDYTLLDTMTIKVKTSYQTIYNDFLSQKGWCYPSNKTEYSIPLKGISKAYVSTTTGLNASFKHAANVKANSSESTKTWRFLDLKLEKNN